MDQRVSQFLSAVLPQAGFRYLAIFYPDGHRTPDGKILPSHRDYTASEQDTMQGFGTWADANRSAEVYVAIGGYVPDPQGKMRRVAACARYHRALRMDIDVGVSTPEKPKYLTKRDAVAALDAFIARFRLPKPWLIDSGGGIHVYWPFDRDVDLTRWFPLADRLKSAAMQHELLADHTTTIDAARILRLPGTMNRKHDVPRPVRILVPGDAHDPAVFEALLPQSAMPASLPTVGRVASEMQQNLHPPYYLRGVLTRCPGMQNMIANKGQFAQEPLWKSVLDLVHRSADPIEVRTKVARHLSMGHPGFSEGGFHNKWQQTQQQDYQPPTCSRLATAGMPECARCPLKASIASPVVLGRLDAAPSPPAAALHPAAPSMPSATPVASPATTSPVTTSAAPLGHVGASPAAPIVVGVFALTAGIGAVAVLDGILTKDLAIRNGEPCQRIEIKKDDGSTVDWWKPICHYRIVAVERLLDRHHQQAITAITFDRHADGMAKVELSHADLSEPRAFNNKLLAAGLHIPRKDAAYLQDTFMSTFLQQLQRARAANKIASHCGWTDAQDGFVLGTTLYTNGSVEHIRPTEGSKREMEAYHAVGDYQRWRAAFDLALSGGADRQAVIALGIAAPLMQFTGVDGLMLNAYSKESGAGKSTLCDGVLSIWGSPDLLRKDFRDTSNATFKLASIVGNLPMVVDEFTNVEGRALSDYVYTITQGREKHRLTADSKLNAAGNRWCLPTIVTSNNSVHEKLQDYRRDAVAEAARVFDLRLRPLNLTPTQMQHNKLILPELRSHYGFLGPTLVKLYMQRTPEQWRELLSNRIADWDRRLAVDAGDRFRSVCAALVEVGAAVGKSLGYEFDLQGVRDIMSTQWELQAQEFDSQRKDPFGMVNSFIVENMAEMAVFGGTQADALISAMPRKFNGEIRGRNVNQKFTADRVMVPVDRLRDYIREQNGSFRAVQEWLRAELAKPNGIVTRMGKLTFLQGSVHQIATQAVEFRASILGEPTLASVPANDVPTTAFGAKK